MSRGGGQVDHSDHSVSTVSGHLAPVTTGTAQVCVDIADPGSRPGVQTWYKPVF